MIGGISKTWREIQINKTNIVKIPINRQIEVVTKLMNFDGKNLSNKSKQKQEA